ncbi:TPA: PAAR domain-containing protein [Raoultella planticola]|nr:PAAR domain-containing protein [Raoultella planticola]
MRRYVVVLGDATTHGGKVTSASSSFDISGKNAALLNDTVSCPKDVSAYEENGRGIMQHGCKTQCGASVIASMPDMEVG